MYMSLHKRVILAATVLMSLQSLEAVNHFARVGKKAVTVNGLFTKFLIHPYAAKTAQSMVADKLLFQKGDFQVHMHEVVDMLTAMLVEALNDKLCGLKNKEALDTAKLVALGVVLHKLAAQAFVATGLQNYLPQETKDMYGLWGAGYMEGILAGIVDEFFNPEKYKEEQSAA